MSSSTPQAGNLMSQLGGSAIGSIVGEGMGLLFNGINTSNQVHDQGLLDQQQLQFNEQQTAYNYGQQLNLWQQTNYPAQVQELEQAGLNPALLYGMHGGGGATTGSPSGNLQAPQAPGTSTGQIAQMAIQSAATQSEINLNNAQAAKIQAETPGAAALQGAQTSNLLAGVTNQQAQAALNQMNAIATGIQNNIQGQTQDDQIASIRAAATQMETLAQQAVRNNYIDQATMDTKISQAKATLVNTYAQTALTKAGITLTQDQQQQVMNQIQNLTEQTAINKMNANTADAAQQTNDKLAQLKQLMFNYELDQGPLDDFMNNITNAMHVIIPMAGKPQAAPLPKVGFKY